MIDEIKEAVQNPLPTVEYAYTISKQRLWLAYLLDELDKADKEIAKYHKLHDDGYNEIRILTEQYEKAKTSVFMWAAECDRLKDKHTAMKETLFSDGVYKALRYYQKQGLCEGNEYSEIDKCFELIDDLECVEGETNHE